MTEKNLKRANEIKKSIDAIKELNRIICYPYPNMISKYKDKRNGFYYDGDVVCFVSLDEQTREELKSSMHEVIDRRWRELEEELASL